MNMYAKVFTSLFDGSMRGHSDLILVFINLLCHSDQDGTVDRHYRAISDETGLSQERVLAALTTLESPDAESRTPTCEGRRIERIEEHRNWGWIITNYKHYRDLCTAKDRRKYMCDYMANKRSKQDVNSCKQELKYVKNDTTSTSISTSISKNSYGEFQNVKLSEEEYSKLLAEQGQERLTQGIDVFGNYLESKGKKYKSHYACLKKTSWVWEKVAKSVQAKPEEKRFHSV